MNDYSLDPGRKKVHAGIAAGLMGVLIMIPVHLVLLLIFQGQTRGDWIAHGIQLLVYFFASQVAAQNHYNGQERSPEALRGVRGAGIGAAITTSLLMWLFVVIRDIVLDALGMTPFLEVVTTFCIVVVDVLLAIALGSWGGSIVEKKYKTFDGYTSE